MLAPRKDTITARKRTLIHQVQLTVSKISKELLKLSILSRLRSLSMLGIPDGGGPCPAVVSPIPRACRPGRPAMPTAIAHAKPSSLFRHILTGHACTYVLCRLYQGTHCMQCNSAMFVSLQLESATASAHTLNWIVTSLSRSVCTAKQVPIPFCSLLDRCMPGGRSLTGLEWEQTRPEGRRAELTSCRWCVAGHQRLLQFCCALLRAPPEPPCEVHPRLFPLHCTPTLLKWDTCTGCVRPHYPSGIHDRLCTTTLQKCKVMQTSAKGSSCNNKCMRCDRMCNEV